ncbi:MAG TPA: hypothetical protein VMT26_02310 [Candidatus Bathyarchaeia archaeon]|jgi:alpha-tubulin suppressor-like RCC1 family protein|nr:hypothetical protein [Candidatus Bathyarchaeia archaeon]
MREIEEKIRLEEKDIQQIIDFLKEYNFIVLEETKKAIKIEEKTRRFLIQKT